MPTLPVLDGPYMSPSCKITPGVVTLIAQVRQSNRRSESEQQAESEHMATIRLYCGGGIV